MRRPYVSGERIALASGRGPVTAFRHGPGDAAGAVVMVGGVGNDVEGPAGTYIDIAERLDSRGIASLRVSYRHTGMHNECVPDVEAAVSELGRQGVARVALVGWSFGGAVVIAAGARCRSVVGVATFATQSYDAGEARVIAPRPLLLIHGTADRILPPSCSQTVYELAGDPRELVLYDGETHTLDHFTSRFVDDIVDWAVPLVGERAGARFVPVPPG